MAGRKRIDIDIDRIEYLAGLGLTEAEICSSLGISEDTLGNRKKESTDFSEAIKRGKAKAAQQVSNALFDKAMQGDTTAIIWYEKTRRGMTDRTAVDHTFKKVQELSDAELRAILET